MRKFTLLKNVFLITLLANVVISCATSNCGFSISKPYVASWFDGKAIGGKVMCIMPVLKSNGYDSTSDMSDTSLLRIVHEIRKDLNFVPFRQSIRIDSLNSTDSLMKSFIKSLSDGTVSVLQIADSAWKRIDADLLALVRLKGGHTVHTFSGEIHKKIMLEGEIWDCRKGEAVFRIVVNGICVSSRVRDGAFIINGVREVFRELPLSSPAYDTQAW